MDVGRAAAEHQIVLTDLRSGAAGLEDLFLELTSDAQRDDLAPKERRHDRHRHRTDPLDVSATPPVPMSRLARSSSASRSTPGPAFGS